MLLTLHATGDRPPEVAWKRYENLDLWSTWSPYLLRAEPAGATLSPGLTGRVHGPLVRAAFRVDAVDEAARRWSWTVRVGPLAVRLAHGVDPDPAGSRTWLVLDGPAPVIVGYAPLARWSLQRLVNMA